MRLNAVICQSFIDFWNSLCIIIWLWADELEAELVQMKLKGWLKLAQIIFDVIFYTFFLPATMHMVFDVEDLVCFAYFFIMAIIWLCSLHFCSLLTIREASCPPSDEDVSCLICDFLDRNPLMRVFISYTHYGLLISCYVGPVLFKSQHYMGEIMSVYAMLLVVFYPLSLVIAFCSLHPKASKEPNELA